MATIQCPNCGANFDHTYRTGRPRVRVSVKKVLNAVTACGNVIAAAEKLGVNRMTIYNRLREGGYDVQKLTKGDSRK